MEEPSLIINLALEDNKTLCLPYSHNIVAEDLCISVCKQLKIGPVVRHLFAFRITGTSIYLDPSTKLRQKHFNLDFRLRFKPIKISKLRTVDPKAYHYYYHQVRQDIIESKIPDEFYEKYKNEILGLSVTDMFRVILEKNLSPQMIEKDYKKYVPKKLLKNHRFFVKKPIQKCLQQLDQRRTSLSSSYLITQYLTELDNIGLEYPIETYKAFTIVKESPAAVMVKVLPPHFTDSGIQYCVESKVQVQQWVALCTIEELGVISMRKDEEIEISRLNGVPFSLKFHSVDSMWSFISLLDGYYRLAYKWTFNLCEASPQLKHLHQIKCHGPVGGEFSYAKLEAKTNNRLGCYILRESETSYTTYYIDVCLRDGHKPSTFKLEQLDKDQFIFDDDPKLYKSVQEVIQAYNSPEGTIYLRECVPPSEYDISPLLLCRKDDGNFLTNSAASPELAASRNCFSVNPKDLQIFSDHKREGFRNMTVVYKGTWQVTRGKRVPVALKYLHPNQERHLMSFMDSMNQWSFLRSSAVTRFFDFSFAGNDVFIVMEHFKLGPLDHYLRTNRGIVKPVDLIEATANLASALWHLQENNIVHGMIRCRKLMVSSHDENTFTVKLSDNGVFTGYQPSDVHWIPVECYNNLSKLSAAGDVWAWATTVYEIFTYGEPLPEMNYNQAVMVYLSGKRLPQPRDCPHEIYSVMMECWQADSRNRIQPQAITKDINQLMYQVYNSRKKHVYDTVLPRRHLDSESDIWQQRSLSSPSSSIASTRRPDSSMSGDWLLDPNQLSDSTQELSRSTDWSNFFMSTSTLSTSNGSSELVHSMENILELDHSHNVILKGRIGQGYYGDVFKGTLESNTDSGNEPITVAVKKLKSFDGIDIPDSNVLDFYREINIMKSLDHPNIVRILGILHDPDLQLVMEYVPHGSLQSYLKINRDSLGPKKLLKFAADIATGMDYLGSQNIVHRDLAARNILVMDEDHVKISDFGLAQKTKNDYYMIHSFNRDLPIKWYAPESLTNGRFSSKSDVWSYGVTLLEMFTYGEDPPMLGNVDQMPEGQDQLVLIEALRKGERYACPERCPQIVYASLMRPCWEEDPHKRPSFKQLSAESSNLVDRV